MSGSCSAGLVSLSASPAIGWGIEQVDAAPSTEASVRFRPTDGSEDRVEVRARCEDNGPVFEVEDEGGEDD